MLTKTTNCTQTFIFVQKHFIKLLNCACLKMTPQKEESTNSKNKRDNAIQQKDFHFPPSPDH
jgi:hypothetical protein